MNQSIFRLHSWLGLINGLLISLVSLTGIVLIFRTELEEAIDPDLLVSSVGTKTVSVDTVYSNIRKGHSGGQVTSVILPKSARDVLRFRLSEAGQNIEVMADPFTGALLGERKTEGYFFQKIFLLHRTLLLGETGKVIMFFFGLSLIASTVTGVYVYRKFIKKLFTRKTTWVEFQSLRRFHSSLGSMVFLINLLFATTGMIMQWPAVTKLFTENRSEVRRGASSFIPKPSLDSILSKSEEETSTFHAFFVGLPADSTKPIVVRGRFGTSPLIPPAKSSIEFDALNGRRGKINNALNAGFFDQLSVYSLPLHAGSFGGMFLKSIYVLLGSCPGALALSGFIMRWRKKKPQTGNRES